MGFWSIPLGWSVSFFLRIDRELVAASFFSRLHSDGSRNARGDSESSSSLPFSPASLSRRCIQVGPLLPRAAFSLNQSGTWLKPSSRSFSIGGISCLYLQPVQVKAHSPRLIQYMQCSFFEWSGSMPDGGALLMRVVRKVWTAPYPMRSASLV